MNIKKGCLMDGLFYFNVVCKARVFTKLVCGLEETQTVFDNFEPQTRN